MASVENSYEEVRRQRVQENLKHLKDLGISDISKSILDSAKSEHKLLRSPSTTRTKKRIEITEVRRSARARNHVASYKDEVDLGELKVHRRRYTSSGNNKREYDGRIASYEEYVRALKRAEKLQTDLKSGQPSFAKAMVRSHVSSCFWLGLPTKFCKDHLPPNEFKIVLEDEQGVEYDAIYIGNRTGLSGGWRAFAIDHHLEDGDVLVFELIEPDRFKIYIIKACGESNQASDDGNNTDADAKDTKKSSKKMKSRENSCSSAALVSQKRTTRSSTQGGKAAKNSKR
ncbi:B3 domain-containing protein Os05g0481400 [Dioscorea cayenensis subsp. rotundata]|uniref:B3 domain-containing protein Os05g0481400 n=1 Tax=Dioscorea cayennensis subsp. rotundata TaxID=55577 RepID=A0AB40BYA4_DIOCR|nr:B3 domain-containing protein Os05g0481400 [Dioscorea cayenensis subsp. rotundata]